MIHAGEKSIALDDIGKAKAEAVRAREELGRSGELSDHIERLAGLEAAISARTQALHWRQRALEEVEAAMRSLHLAQVPQPA